MNTTSWVYTDRGQEKELSFIWMHGWGQRKESLLRLADLLHDQGHHRLFDLPGFGSSPLIDPNWGTEDYGKALIDLLPEKPVILVGHSFGCRVAIRAAHAQPDRIKALILIAGAGLKPKRSLWHRSRAFLLRLGSKTAGLIDRTTGGSLKARYAARFGSSDYKAAGALRTTLVKTVTEDLAPIAAEIACPVLLITGEMDRETPPAMAQRFQNLFQNAEMHIVPGFDHLDILNRGVYQCDALIKAFLSRLEKAAGD